MPLTRRAVPFSHPDWLFEIKHDGFRALAYIERGTARLLSRNVNWFKSFPALCDGLAADVKVHSAVLDGEIVCLDKQGCSQFNQLFYRRGDPRFYAFDLLYLNGRDLRKRPLAERKARLRSIIPPQPSRILLCDCIEADGNGLFAVACQRDLEGIVAKWKHGKYVSGPETSWVKIKNRAYSQIQGRREQFEKMRTRAASTGK
jgi:bifunctional non-homologous end joining protein LigD